MLLPLTLLLENWLDFENFVKYPGMEGMSTAVKYNVNTYYGLTCSVWFSTNSTMVGDRITRFVFKPGYLQNPLTPYKL
jgi:hypothetical protein